MRAAEVAFVGALVHEFPTLMSRLQDHLDDYDGLLPHVFLGDVTRWILANTGTEGGVEMDAMLDFLEDCFSHGHEHERELISVSFLENLPRPNEPGAEVRGRLGPEMLRHLEVIG